MIDPAALATSPDGQWAATRRGREVALLAAGAGPGVGQLALEGDDAEIAFVGPPVVLVTVVRGDGTRIALHQPPYLDVSARLDLEHPARLAAVTGPRMAFVSSDSKQVTIVRAAGRALSAQSVDPGGPVELAVGLDRNQLLFAVLRKLEVWDAVSGRPLLRLQLQLPPPPRVVGTAAGHLWVTRPDSDDLVVFRLSDGRPFRHQLGAPIESVICHPSSPLLVAVTSRGLVRVHCLAHRVHGIDAPWTPGTPLAQLVTGDDVTLLGLAPETAEPWRVAIGGPTATGEVAAAASEPARAPDPRPRAPEARAARTGAWRDPLVAYATELVRGGDAELPIIGVDSELGELAHRLALPPAARRALVALYGAYLIGEPAVAIARLARALGDWTEPLGQGDLAALAMLRKHAGKIALRRAVTDALDGTAPHAIRVVGGTGAAPRPGATRIARDGRTDAVLESLLAGELGRIAVLEGAAATGLLESRLVGATAVALAAPANRPSPWPRDASLVVVGDPAAPPWVSALPDYVTAS